MEKGRGKMTQSIEFGSSKATKIVLVDDDAFVLRVHAGMLKALGYVPFTFESPDDALEYLQGYREHVSMVISDYRMPQMNGLKFISRFRSFDTKTPAIILTGFASELDKEEVKRCDVTVLDKPVRMHVLQDHVRSRLSGN